MGRRENRPPRIRGPESMAATEAGGHRGGPVHGGTADGRAGHRRRGGQEEEAPHDGPGPGPGSPVLLTCWSGTSPPPRPAARGSPTSPTSTQPAVLCIQRSSPTCFPAGSRGGRLRIRCAPNWPSMPWRWRSGHPAIKSAASSSIIRTGVSSTCLSATGRGWVISVLSVPWGAMVIPMIMRPRNR